MRRKTGSVTLADVASDVGVSARTVSRVVNGEGGCTTETRDRILDAIDRLGYRPNLLARGLIRQRSDTMGFLTPSLLDPFFPEFAHGLQTAAAELHQTLYLVATGGDRTHQREAISSLQSRGVDGIILFPAPESEVELLATAAEGLPIVSVNTEIGGPRIGCVTAEIQLGATMAVQHLWNSGRRNIALLLDSGARRGSTLPRREVGYRNALLANGAAEEDHTIVGVHNSIEGGQAGMRSLLASGAAVDAVFAYNDLIALGALRELESQGIAVPDDIAVVGFDDITMCEVSSPALTTIRIDRDQLGRTAVRMLQQLIDEPDFRPPTSRLAVDLVLRQTA